MKAKDRKERAGTVVGELQQRLEQSSAELKKALGGLQPRKKRGGARPGAGRPLKKGVPASERVIFRLTPDEIELLKGECQEGESPNQAARRVLLGALRKGNTP